MVAHMEEQMQNPEFAKQWYENQAKFKLQVLKSTNIEQRNNVLNPIVIPVAVHFPGGQESDRSCLEALAQTQIDILNGDYTATNSDANLWNSASQFYPGAVHGIANITFCIATQNHPNNTDNDLVEGGPAVTIGYNFGGGGDNDGAWSGYMNFLVKNINGGILGYSPLGGSIAAGQSVVINLFAFGSGAGCPNSGVVPGAPYNFGRTITHELGHFYNLSHIWGDGGCGVDDGISDTPLASGSNGGCPSPGSIPGCVPGQYEMSMNYMDYTNDACMYMFTQGQMNVVDNYINVLQSQFKPNTVNCSSTVPDFFVEAQTTEPVFSCPSTGDDATFEFIFSTANGFNNNINFYAAGQPEGSIVTFSPQSASSDTNVIMTVSNISNTQIGNYSITVNASIGAFFPGKTLTFNLNNNCTSIQCDNFYSDENLNISIPDGIGANQSGDAITSTITVPDLGILSSISVNVDVTHSYIQDLGVFLYHPDQVTYAVLWGRDCGDFDDFDITFSDEGTEIICGNPTVGTFAPYESLSVFDGMDTAGDWTLQIQDYYNGDIGSLNDWSIEICTEAPLSINAATIGLQDLTIYPNPNKGVFNVTFPYYDKSEIKMSIYDIRGRKIIENQFNNIQNDSHTVNISTVEAGVYLAVFSDGNNQITKRIIIN
jgi:subtilisin-like proprotein convertase family protein